MDHTWILAQADINEAPARIGSEPMTSEGEATVVVPDSNNVPPVDSAKRPVSPLMQFLPLILIFVVIYMFMLRGPRKQQQKHKQMVQALSKNDRVRTIGGILGTVVDVRGDEVTLKVDETNNTKIRISTSAIGKNLSQEGKD
ncbi:MAG: preprotein translocase subunit YajC [Phycisphaerales bacterium]|nr:MAG: preprotein translocase subunit YajC [Phycisphaerales bacterium]